MIVKDSTTKNPILTARHSVPSKTFHHLLVYFYKSRHIINLSGTNLFNMPYLRRTKENHLVLILVVPLNRRTDWITKDSTYPLHPLERENIWRSTSILREHTKGNTQPNERATICFILIHLGGETSIIESCVNLIMGSVVEKFRLLFLPSKIRGSAWLTNGLLITANSGMFDLLFFSLIYFDKIELIQFFNER